jgi:hypothetical protein
VATTITVVERKLMRPRHMTMAVAVTSASLAGAALVVVVNLQAADEPATAIPPTLTPPTAGPPLPAQSGVVPLEPEPVAAPNPPKTHATTSTIRSNGDWMRVQRQMASHLCSEFGASC